MSTDVEKAFSKSQHSLIIKTLKKVGIESSFLNIKSTSCNKPVVNAILNRGKWNRFLLKWRATVTMSIWYSSTAIRQEINKRIQMEKEKVKVSLFVDDVIRYLEDPKDSTKGHLELISEFRKIAWYKNKH